MLKSKKFWGIVASFFFLWLALKKVDLRQIPPVLATLRYKYLILIVISFTIEHLSRAKRWQMILHDKEMSFAQSYAGIVLGYLFNNLLPARAGEFLRAFYLKKKNIASGSEAFGSVVFERFLDGIIIVSFIIFSLNHFTVTPLIQKASMTAIVFYAGVLIAILLLQFQKPLFVSISGSILAVLPKRLEKPLVQVRDSFINGLAVISQPMIFLKTILMSVICWALSLFTLWLCLEMFSMNMGIAETALLASVLAIGSMIPSSPGMIGIYQFCCVLTLNGMLGVSAERAATYGLVCHTISYIYVLFAGFLVMTIEGLKFSDLSQARNKETSVSATDKN